MAIFDSKYKLNLWRSLDRYLWLYKHNWHSSNLHRTVDYFGQK